MLMIWGVNISAPGSLLSTAICADASSTTLLKFGGLAPFRNQIIHQGGAGLDIFPDQSLSALNSAFQVVIRSSSSSMRKITSSPALIPSDFRYEAGMTTRPFSLTRVRVSTSIQWSRARRAFE
jgi:hypothetical protein